MKLTKDNVYIRPAYANEAEIEKFAKIAPPDIFTECKGKTAITYEKFMELFGSEEKPKEILTLENVQVDCSELTEEQVKEMANVFENNGYESYHDIETTLKVENQYVYIKGHFGRYIVGIKSSNKTTITYEKFMELFTGSVEVLNEEKYIADLTLEQQLQKAEAEVKRLKEAIEASKIKEGDWCKFWNHDKDKFIIVKFQGNKFACISTGEYFLDCEKITNPELIKLLEQFYS